MELTFRRLTAADAKAYRHLRLESLRLYPQYFGSSYEEQRSLPKLMFEEALEHPPDSRFVIGGFAGQALIAIFGFIPHAQDPFTQAPLAKTGMAIQMYVVRAYQGKHVGVQLTLKLIEEAFKLGEIDTILLAVNPDNVPAIRTYETAGFELILPPPGAPITGPAGMWMKIDR